MMPRKPGPRRPDGSDLFAHRDLRTGANRRLRRGGNRDEQGVEEFDAQNKALIWSTDGGKNRRLIGGADAFTEDTMDGFGAAAEAVLAKVPSFGLKTMQAEQERLTARQQRLGACDGAVSMWRILAIKEPKAVRNMDGKDLTALANSIKEANHDAG